MEYILVHFFIFFSCNVTDFFGLYIYFGFAAAGHYVDVGVYVTVIFVCVCVFFFGLIVDVRRFEIYFGVLL